MYVPIGLRFQVPRNRRSAAEIDVWGGQDSRQGRWPPGHPRFHSDVSGAGHVAPSSSHARRIGLRLTRAFQSGKGVGPMTLTRIRIRALAHGGDGVGAVLEGEGPTWFVPATLPEEIVDAEPTRHAKRFVQGEAVDIIERSPHRVDPSCGLAQVCGGCQWQHVEPLKQAEFKARIVADQLRKLKPGVRVGFSGSPQGYRRRARVHYRRSEDGFTLGFHAQRSRAVVDANHCPVLAPALDAAIQRLREVAGMLPAAGEVLGLTDGTKVVLGLPRVKPTPDVLEALRVLLDDQLVGIEARGGRQRGHVGERTLDIDGGGKWAPVRVGAFSFGQANAAGNRALVAHVVAQAQADGLRVLELYAGSGNFTRALAQSAQRVWASDTDHDAIATLQGLAKARSLPINAKRQSAPRLMPKLVRSGADYDVIVLDPPRAGLGEEGMEAACRVANQRIVYVSCDPATLARDLEVALSKGFELEDITVFDLMPMTAHIEIVATLRAKSLGVGGSEG